MGGLRVFHLGSREGATNTPFTKEHVSNRSIKASKAYSFIKGYWALPVSIQNSMLVGLRLGATFFGSFNAYIYILFIFICLCICIYLFTYLFI